MNYPLRYKYRGIGSHARWMRDILKHRKESNKRIARLGQEHLQSSGTIPQLSRAGESGHNSL